jgi:hypothetical protein
MAFSNSKIYLQIVVSVKTFSNKTRLERCKTYSFENSEISKTFFMLYHNKRQQVTLTTTAQSNRRLEPLLLERNMKGNVGIQRQCGDVIRGHCCKLNVPAVAQCQQ